MQDKQKVTLYLPPELHRQLKIRAAVDAEPMSDLAERAIGFYLKHPEVVEEFSSYGAAHRIYNCPECDSALALRDGDIVAIGNQPGILLDDLDLQALTSEEMATEELVGARG